MSAVLSTDSFHELSKHSGSWILFFQIMSASQGISSFLFISSSVSRKHSFDEGWDLYLSMGIRSNIKNAVSKMVVI